MGDQAGGRPTSSAPGLRDDAAGSSGGKPGTTRASRSPSRLHSPSPADSSASLNTTQSSQSRKEYMDSLVVPPKEELARISEVQEERESENKRRSRELQRRSLDAPAVRPSSSLSSGAGAGGSLTPPGGRAGHHKHQESLTTKLRLGHSVDDILRHRAATVIQRHYRGYRARRQIKGLGIDSSTRWVHAIREAQYRELTRPRARAELEADGDDADPSSDGGAAAAAQPESAAKRNWKKAARIARRANLDQDSSDSESDSESSSGGGDHASSEDKAAQKKRKAEAKERRRKEAKAMGLAYFLEMVDLKHRYGSNLRTYHEEWRKSDTHENFFYWLDYGEGRMIDIESCPRERLDREQVRYLSREERQYYLVKVDSEGRLCWSKNGVRIDTTEKWKDSVHGIVPADDPTPAYKPSSGNETTLLGDSSTGESEPDDEEDASESELEAARAAKYATPGLDEAKGVKKISHVSASTIFNKLLRKSVKKNTWIFVADTSFRLYVGIKNSGAFQHSSFLQGSRISAAGLIKIKNGRLASLSPLSGHYRPPAANFRAFVKSLKEAGVDMSHVSISKSYAVLVGLEAYMKTRQKGKDVMKKLTHRRDKIMSPEVAKRREEEERDKSQSAELERKFLEEQERQRDENKVTVQLMQKLKVTPREPDGQKGEEDGHGDRELGATANGSVGDSVAT